MRESSGPHVCCARGVRRLAHLAAETGDEDIVHQALMHELRTSLDLESVSIAPSERAPEVSSPAAEGPARSSQCRGLAGDRWTLVLELPACARGTQIVVMARVRPRSLACSRAAPTRPPGLLTGRSPRQNSVRRPGIQPIHW